MIGFERTVAASPLWLQLQDTFTGRPPAGPLRIVLERRMGTAWQVLDQRPSVTSAGDVAFVNLARTAAAAGSFDLRLTVGAPGLLSTMLTTTVAAWQRDTPSSPAAPTRLRLFPAPDYPYPAGVPLLAGRVVDAAGAPVPGAGVTSRATVAGTPVTEEARTDDDGRFRLPLRWSSGATDIQAAHAGRTAAITVAVPADLSTTHQLTLT